MRQVSLTNYSRSCLYFLPTVRAHRESCRKASRAGLPGRGTSSGSEPAECELTQDEGCVELCRGRGSEQGPQHGERDEIRHDGHEHRHRDLDCSAHHQRDAPTNPGAKKKTVAGEALYFCCPVPQVSGLQSASQVIFVIFSQRLKVGYRNQETPTSVLGVMTSTTLHAKK